MKTKNILIVEDDQYINNLLKEILEDDYQVVQAFSGSEASLVFNLQKPDLVILDLMLPGLSGPELVDLIRRDSVVPIIIISAKLDMETKVELLSLGADDFIEKPFDIKEVVARAKAQLRRYVDFSKRELREEKLEYKNLSLYPDERKLLVFNQELKLTAKEYDILKLLLDYPNKVFTKANLYQSVWGEDLYIDDNTLNVHISNLRNKLGQLDGEEDYIETVWGIGFKLSK